MIKNNKENLIISLLTVFVIIELILAAFIQILDAKRSDNIAYVAIILVFLFSFIPEVQKGQHIWLVRLALALTVCADYFLLIADADKYIFGVLLFLIVQLIYAVYLYVCSDNKRAKKRALVFRVLLSLLAPLIVFALLGKGADALSIISVLCYAELLSNAFVSIFVLKNKLLFVAFVLFALCDLWVGFDTFVNVYIGVERGSFLYKLTNSHLNVSWLFYLPSQVLILFTSIYNKSKVNRKK